MKSKQQYSPLNILLVDDDKDDCIFFDTTLKKLSHPTHLTTVHDGEELMSYLSKNSNRLPDVIFLDLNMPRKNGFECLVEIKENEKLKDLNVIMFSTSIPQDKNYEREMIASLFKIGAIYFIRKSSDFNLLKQDIDDSLKKVIEKIRSINKNR